MTDNDCIHVCSSCRECMTHVPNCDRDDGEDDTWLCPKCEEKRRKRERRDELSAAMAKFREANAIGGGLVA